MGNLFVVFFVLLILIFFYDVIYKFYVLKKFLVIVVVFCLIYFLGLDIFVFLKNLYLIRVKLIDFLLRIILGGVYKKYKIIWSF